MIVFTVEERERGEFIVRIDPHAGACQGAHDVIVSFMPVGGLPHEKPVVHASLTWGPSALLSAAGSREFATAIELGCRIAEQLPQHASNMAEAHLMVHDLVAMMRLAAEQFTAGT